MLKRRSCLDAIKELLTDELVIVNHAGVAKEWFSIVDSDSDFPTQMGVACATGLGLALALPDSRVVVLEGDGSLLFSIGILSSIGKMKPTNLSIVVFDNESYEVVYNDIPTATASGTNLEAIAKNSGIERSYLVTDIESFKESFKRSLHETGPTFINAKVEKDPFVEPIGGTIDPVEKKYRFVRYVEKKKGIHILTNPRSYKGMKLTS